MKLKHDELLSKFALNCNLRHYISGSIGGQRYDEDPKRWWAVTSVMEDVARALEVRSVTSNKPLLTPR